MQKQTYLENYLGYIQAIERTQVITEMDYLIEMISKEKIANMSKKQMQYIEKAMKKLGIGIDYIKAQGKKMSKKIKSDYDKGKTFEVSAKEVTASASRVVSQAVEKAKDDILALSTGEKILVAILAFLVIFYFNSALGLLVLAIVGDPVRTTAILAVIIAPMVEEAAKNYFIERDMPWIGTGVFAGLEALHYLAALIFGGASVIAKFAIVRMSTLGLHFATTAIQKKIIDKGKDVDKDRKFIAWLTGFGIHATWNTLGLVYNAKIVAWVMK